MVRVQLLGRFSVQGTNGEASFPTAKTRLLAAYLIWRQGQWVRRDLLRGLFWGDKSEERAAASLRTALYFLRRSFSSIGLPEAFLQVRRDAVRIRECEGITVDLREFEKCIPTGLSMDPDGINSRISAEGLYAGDFLEGVDADWVGPERERLANLRLALLRELVERLLAIGRPQDALLYATRWLDLDPTDESAHRALMRIHFALGSTARLATQYEVCCRILRAELGVEPSAQTQQLYKDLRRRLLPERSETGANVVRAPGSPPAYRGSGRTPDAAPTAWRARLDIIAGESLALAGEGVSGIKSMEAALQAYGAGGAFGAKAKLLVGESLVWLSVPLVPELDDALRRKGLAYIDGALSYFRAQGRPVDIMRALELRAQVRWVLGFYKRAVEDATECLEFASALSEREAQARAWCILAMALREQHKIRAAREAMEKALGLLPELRAEWEILWVLLQSGILSYIAGNLREAKQYLKESLSVSETSLFPSLRTKIGECMARSMIVLLLHYEGKYEEMADFVEPDMARFNPEPFNYLNPLLSATGGRRAVLAAAEAWLTNRLSRLPAPMVACTLRTVVEEMISAGLFHSASRWASVGVRMSRTNGWGSFEAMFWCLRAVALIKSGRSNDALGCQLRAQRTRDGEDPWVDAWLARAKGLISIAAGQFRNGEEHLAESSRIFRSIGDLHDAQAVESEASDLTRF